MKIELDTLGEKEEFVLSEIQMILNLHIAMQTTTLKRDMSVCDDKSNDEMDKYVLSNGKSMLLYYSILKQIVKSMRIVE